MGRAVGSMTKVREAYKVLVGRPEQRRQQERW
jgi:hypothetical protein